MLDLSLLPRVNLNRKDGLLLPLRLLRLRARYRRKFGQRGSYLLYLIKMHRG